MRLADEPAPGGPRPLVVRLGLALLCAIWGSTWLVIRTGLEDLPALTSAAIRFTVAVALFSALTPFLRRREGGERPPVRLVLAMGVFNFAVPYGLLYWAEQVIPSSLASVLWAVFPMMMAAAGHRWLGERLRPIAWLGFAGGFVGVALLFATDLRALGGGAVGVALVYLLSPGISTVGHVIVKRDGARTSSVELTRGGLGVCAVLLWAVALPLEAGEELRWTPRALFSVAYLAVVGTVVAFGIYFWLMRFAPAHQMSLIAYVVPVIALGLGWGLGNEAVGLHTLVGTGLILSGIVAVARGRASAPAPPAPEPPVPTGIPDPRMRSTT